MRPFGSQRGTKDWIYISQWPFSVRTPSVRLRVEGVSLPGLQLHLQSQGLADLPLSGVRAQCGTCAKLTVLTACIKGPSSPCGFCFCLSTLSTFSHRAQVHDLHLYGSSADSALRDSMWEVQTYVHFQDNEGVTVIIKPEHRVEDVLALACKVISFAIEIHTSE